MVSDVLVLGIDPGYDRCGLVVLKKNQPKNEVVFSDCLVTKRTASFNERLFAVGETIEKIILAYSINFIALEKLFVAKNLKTATAVSEVRGMILYLAQKHHVPVMEFSPPTIKLSVTGSGNADKHQVTTMVKLLTDLSNNKRHDDEFDAIAIALTGLAYHRAYPQNN